jgi:hypothetical protein
LTSHRFIDDCTGVYPVYVGPLGDRHERVLGALARTQNAREHLPEASPGSVSIAVSAMISLGDRTAARR